MRKRLAAVVLLLGFAALLTPSVPRPDPDAIAADERWGTVPTTAAGNSLWLVRPGGAGEAPPGRTVRQDRPQPARRRSETLRDALNPLSGETDASGAFWQRFFASGLRAATRGPDGKVSVSRALPSAAGNSSVRRAQNGTAPNHGGSSPNPQAAPASWAGSVSARPSAKPSARTHIAESQAAPRPDSAVNFDGRAGTAGSRRAAAAPPVPAGGPIQAGRKEQQPRAKAPAEKIFSLADWLGIWAYHPPEGRVTPPSFAALKTSFPPSLPGGRGFDHGTPAPAMLEHIAPPGERPDYDDWLYKDDHSRRGDKPHWHWDGAAPVFHAGKAWGVVAGGHWAWMLEADRRWWTLGDGAQRLVRHDQGWWWRTEDGWFLLKGGQPWAWRSFPEWKGQGFIHPNHGTQVVYSADASRVAVLTPGQDTMVFDAASGQVLARFPPEQVGRPPLPD